MQQLYRAVINFASEYVVVYLYIARKRDVIQGVPKVGILYTVYLLLAHFV